MKALAQVPSRFRISTLSTRALRRYLHRRGVEFRRAWSTTRIRALAEETRVTHAAEVALVEQAVAIVRADPKVAAAVVALAEKRAQLPETPNV